MMSNCKLTDIYPRQKLYGNYNSKDFLKSIFLKNLDKTYNKKKIEKKIKSIFISKYARILNHERIGFYIIIKNLLKLNPQKKEIILSPYTIWDVVNMVILAGGKPIFVDINKKDFTISNATLKKAINKNTLAIIFTHYHTLSSEIDIIKNYLDKKKIFLIEDCAIFVGSDYLKYNRPKKNQFRLLSFGRSKFVSSISGGAILLNNNKVLEMIDKDLSQLSPPSKIWIIGYYIKTLKLLFFSNTFMFRASFFWILKFLHLAFYSKYSRIGDNDPNPKLHIDLPKNYLSDISDYQINIINKKLNKTIYKDKITRISNAKIYYNELKNIKKLTLLKKSFSQSDVYINYPILCKERDNLHKFLILNNYDCSTYFYKDCNSLTVFKKFHKKLNNVKYVNNNILVLPTYPDYPKKNIVNICKLIKSFYA